MVAVPGPLIPVTVPVVVIDAVPGLALVHVPPGVELLSVPLENWHITSGPEKLPGNGLTVTIAVRLQPVPRV
jgi:hypothetical protein